MKVFKRIHSDGNSLTTGSSRDVTYLKGGEFELLKKKKT
jgi:hypothetical protein